MACCGNGREKEEKISATHKWDYINLSDFKATSCFTPLSYGILYISLIISVAVYVVDIFIAINLLLFNKWAGQIDPFLDFRYSRWIFAGCILLSLVLLVYRWYNAIKAIRSGGVAQSYLDPLAVRLQSIRTGARGRGWRRFLVFADLTKSKKGAEYVALFVYFSFEAWIRIVFAEGPRKVINAMTLYEIMTTAHIVPGAGPTSGNPVGRFFENVRDWAEEDNIRAAIVFSMLFTLVIWVFAALSLLISCILWLLFLWHHIPKQDGNLRRYCKRKIDGRLQKIVDVKINKALAKEETRLGLKSNNNTGLKKQPTIPILGAEPSLVRQDTKTSAFTTTTFPIDEERQIGSGGNIYDNTLDKNHRPPILARTTTMSTNTSADSYSPNAPLIGAASRMGTGPALRPYSPAPSSFAGSQSDAESVIYANSNPGGSHRPPPPRSNTSNSNYSNVARKGVRTNDYYQPQPRSNTTTPANDYFSQGPGGTEYTKTQQQGHGAFRGGRNPDQGPNGRQMPVQEYEMRTQTPRAVEAAPPTDFVAYRPTMSPESRGTPPPPYANPAMGQQRNFSAPQPSQSYGQPPSARNFSSPNQYPPRSTNATPGASAPGQQSSSRPYDSSIYDSY